MTEIVREFQLAGPTEWSPRFNIAPTQPVLTVTQEAGAPRAARCMLWGLIPSWAKDRSIANSLINARAESVADKPSFRAAFKRRRCLIVADGYYEWQKTGKAKQPFHIRFPDNRPFAIAGLWESWGESHLETCTLITTDANETTRPIHDRMPVILDPPDAATWLESPPENRDELLALLRPYRANQLVTDAVSTYVNNPRHEDPGCLTGNRSLF
jgi:putative SOS response-associated peptidase YedK